MRTYSSQILYGFLTLLLVSVGALFLIRQLAESGEINLTGHAAAMTGAVITATVSAVGALTALGCNRIELARLDSGN